MTPPIQLSGVWKSFGTHHAVRDLHLTVPSQGVYGFLGPNGAGKSTTIRMILGLQSPTRGTIQLFGQSLPIDRHQLLRRTGSLVESPALYPHLTGRENLEVHRRLLNLPRTAIDQALETVGLSSVATRLVRKYSSGMQQRLGIALALLASPELLLLDEPTNGLDPAGIHEIRNLVQDLPRQAGVTVFLSSHLLAEVEQIATHIAIIANGCLRFEGTAAELRQRRASTLAVDVDRPTEAQAVLHSLGIPLTLHSKRLSIPLTLHSKRLSIPNASDPAAINTALVNAGIAVSRLAEESATLEDIFLEITE